MQKKHVLYVVGLAIAIAATVLLSKFFAAWLSDVLKCTCECACNVKCQ